MIIYKHTSKTSGKSYIGLTKYTLEYRLNGHLKEAARGSELQFHKAIRKYGIHDFESAILEEVEDYELLKEREMFWISHFDTFKNGYNMTPGGETGPPVTDEQIEKMVKTRKENGSYITGAKKRLETIGDDIHKIVEKTANTRRERGDFEKLSEKVKGVGIGYIHTCEYCGKDVKGANFKRWHGDNCKQNPNITEEQLKEREPWNKGKKDVRNDNYDPQ